MIYRVLCDGQDIFNPQDKAYNLIEPELSIELNTAGSFEFTMHPSHPFYDSIKPLVSVIEVYEDEVMLWFGRPVEVSTDFYKQKKIYCEGAMAFFNDSVQRLHEYDSISLHTFFETVIANHNEQVDSYKQFTVGTITMDDATVYRKLNYNSTFDCLKTQCLNAKGGYFFIRRENGVNYIDWLKEMPYSTNQPVEFGLNMLNASSNFDMSDFCTCVLPLGDEVDGARLTVESVNNGNDIIDSAAVSEYGRIVKCVEFSGVTNVDTLYEDGVQYLEDKQFDNLTIECTAAELHWQNTEYASFRIGQKIHAHSVPHLIDRYFDLLKMNISLKTAEKQITLGTVRKPTLTEIASDKKLDDGSLRDINDQLQDLQDDLDKITDVPDPDEIKKDIRDNLDDIDNLLNDDDFKDHIQDLLDDDLLDDWLLDHDVDPADLDDISPEVVIDLIGDDIDDIFTGFDDTDDYDVISGMNDDLGDYWNNNSDIFNYDTSGSGGGTSNYDTINQNIAGTTAKIQAATDSNTKDIYALKAQVILLQSRVDSLWEYNELMVTWEKEVEAKMTELEELVRAVAVDAWVHQIDGEQVEVGIVNFVTSGW